MVASHLHLAVAGLLLVASPWDGALAERWDALLWLLLIGFVGLSTAGFALHLFPAFAQRPLPHRPTDRLAFPLAEAAVLLGAVTLGEVPGAALPAPTLAIAAALYLGAVAILLSRFVGAARMAALVSRAGVSRPADRLVVPLFLASWSGAIAAGALFALSAFSDGPGFGWWVAGVHVFVLGHVVLLILGSSLRLVPRSLGADPPFSAALIVAVAGGVGAVSVPLGMLLVPTDAALPLALLGLPEAAAALGLLTVLFLLGGRARTPRSQLALHVGGIAFFCAGGGLGLWMVSVSSYGLLSAHALVNLVGFVGLTILVMSFGMLAPFQRVSHDWSRRMMWGLALLWVVAVGDLVVVGVPLGPGTELPYGLLGAATAIVAGLWAVGTIPVLYPRLNPLPGVRFERVQAMRERWHER